MPDSPVEALAQQAQQAMAMGRLDDAARMWGQVLSAVPNHSQALLHLGQHAAYRGDLGGAVQFLNRAAAAAPNDPVVLFNLSFVHRRAGDIAAELAALERAITADPYYLPALLAKGTALEKTGKPRQAARVFRDALAITPPDAQLVPEMRAAAAHAREAVRKNAENFEAFLAEKRVGADAPSEAFREAAAIAAGTTKAFVQQPTMLHYPRLPAIPFYDRAQFPWLAEIEAATDIIREEMLAVLHEQARDFGPYIVQPQGTQAEYAPRWKAYFLYRDGKRVDENCARCPKTAALMEKAPLAEVPGAAPVVFFSVLEPKTGIPPHTGVTNTRLIVHLPLVIPGKCWFRVGNERREWRLGEALIFDDTIEHEAHNESDELRVLLIFDIWNPYLSKAEQGLVCQLIAGIQDFYKE